MEQRQGILLVLPSLTALGGGIELYCRQFLAALARARPEAHMVAVLGREPRLLRPELLDAELRARLTVVGAPQSSYTRRVAETVARTAWEALRGHPQMVVCGHVNYAALAATLAGTVGARLVTLLYGIEAWHPRPWTMRQALTRADLTICISAFTAAQVLRVLPIDLQRVAIVPNAVDTTRFSPGPPSRAIAEKLQHLPRPRLLTVARLEVTEGYKGVEQVLRALTRIPRRPSYLVVGAGGDLARLRALAAELGVDVEFYGRAPDEELPDLYRACDLFIMPSWKEGFGYVFIEALACGLPVIAGCVDGSVEALDGGRLGALISPFDLDQMVATIGEQLDASSSTSPEARHAAVATRFGHAAFERKLNAALERIERA